MLIYTVFQAVVMLITTLCVATAASRMLANSRVGEFAVMRALGADRDAIRRVAYPVVGRQTIWMLALAIGFNWLFSNITRVTYINSTEGAVSVSEIFSWIMSCFLSAALFLVPAMYGGLMTVLHKFFRQSIITSIRERE